MFIVHKMAASSNKSENIKKIIVEGVTKFECLKCNRQLSTMQRIMHHLHSIHDMSPVKRVKKLYVDNDDLEVPRRTKNRWKKKRENEMETLSSQTPFTYSSQEDDLETGDVSTENIQNEPDHCNELSLRTLYDGETDTEISGSCEQPTILQSSSSMDLSGESLSSSCSTNSLTDSSDAEFSSGTDISSDTDTSYDTDTLSDTELSSSSEGHGTEANSEETNSAFFLTNEFESLKIISCFRRHNLTTSASKDIIDTMKTIFTDSEKHNILNFDYLMSFIQKYPIIEVHYCEICFEVFPDNLAELHCGTENCNGRRFDRDGQPRKCFVFADLQKQLADLLQSPGVIDDIKKQIRLMQERWRQNENTLTDLTDGKAYRSIIEECEGFDGLYLTALLNTDGVNLYSSSKVELWPVFLALNELNPKARFSRDNLLLVGIWQGKGKPPFKSYIKSLSVQLNKLLRDGIQISVDGSAINVKLRVTCGIFDLPAKAAILNMMYFNGKNACITCEEEGKTVKQGKGTARCFPYRNGQVVMRSHMNVLDCMENGTIKKPVKGFKGISGLTFLDSFNLVDSIIPDYMHGVLLGITSMLLAKWFSPTNGGKDFFIGKNLKKISSRLQHIKPPSSIERLPRDLEKHYKSLKATELQAFLLYYGIPCLIGILPDIFLNHYSYLSEAIYILLGDNITVNKLERAESLLTKFYESFTDLYGPGSCGLNIHNTCSHLVHYVKLWGPLWAWSCFGFEDNNANLLQSVHGTGVVTKQVMLCKQVEATLRRKSLSVNESRIWKITYTAQNCEVCGKLMSFDNLEGYRINPNLLEMLSVDNAQDGIKIIGRISVKGQQFASSIYKRMKKRICSYVLYDSTLIGCLKYFVLAVSSNVVYAVIEKYEVAHHSTILDLEGGKHIIPVQNIGTEDIRPADKLSETLVYVKTCHEVEDCVVMMPSRHGHAIFK